jgi:hypothetical protein
VFVGVHHVGYIPAELAEQDSPRLLRLASVEALATGEARICAKDDGGLVRGSCDPVDPEAAVFI